MSRIKFSHGDGSKSGIKRPKYITDYEYSLRDSLFRAAPEDKPAILEQIEAIRKPILNNCDGCARGLTVIDGLHRENGMPVQGCTSHLYESIRKPIPNEKDKMQ